ncbi:TonB-dependent receptor plug domain-containing protein [Acetobacter thailandicus]|uniref:TonB-dependent receptor plug domain-containing protein n=1 Tax=Acetobacter thailandicus TaxID=1502842 RepID=UPI001BAC9565|nr:TonB-dependent receptor [Acetobacter thailandicus]MBS0981003.1 TonB-dependent receptor [Acetobacter thailandicus]
MIQIPHRKSQVRRSFRLLYVLPVFSAGFSLSASFAYAQTTGGADTTAAVHHVKKKATRTRNASTAKASSAHQTAATSAGQSKQVATSKSAVRVSNAKTLDQATVAGSTEAVTVTGSFLKQARQFSANPVQTITAKEIQQTGVTNVGDFLLRMPSVGSSGTGNADTNGGAGMSCTDIRNLGGNRVLVLVDGKRVTQSSTGVGQCVDMNSIPVMAISSIEILKDGGSELYGADAVSGVINIKMKHDVNTGGVTMRGSLTQYGDNRQFMASAYKGWNFDHNRGNVTIFGQFSHQDGVKQWDRKWARNPQTNDPANGYDVSYGSSIPTNGMLFGPLQANGNQDVFYGNSKGGLTNNSSGYNYAQDQMILNELDNSSLMGDAHYDFNKHFTLYSNVMYSHKTSSTTMAPIPATGSSPPSTLPGSIVLPTNYPGNTSGEELTMYRRMAEFGKRKADTSVDALTSMVGAKGDIIAGWKYDASFTYGSTMGTMTTSGVGNYSKLLQVWGLTPDASTSAGVVYNPNACAGAAGCSFSSALSPLSQEATAYANYKEHDHYHYQLRDTNVRIHNDNVVKMPYAHGGSLGIALGMEHRSEQLSYTPDPLIQQGNTLSNTMAATGGGFNASEAYLEGNLTLLHNAMFAKNLSVDGQGRYSGYNTFGNTYNWKVGINWAPTRDIAFRGTLGTSFRQPNVFELYGGKYLSYNGAYDPCDNRQIGNYNGTQPAVVANCMKRGINPYSFKAASWGQVPTLMGGNTKLQPEVGRTYTFGATMTPRWVPGLMTSVSFWHYRVSNMITSLPTQYILDGCYTGERPANCAQITRLSNGQINSVESYNINGGAMTTSGIDWDLTYRIRLTWEDSLIISNNFQKLVSYKQQLVPGGQTYDMKGTISYQAQGTSNPTVRDYASFTWRHNDFSVTYMLQYMSGMHWNDGSSRIYPQAASYDAQGNYSPGVGRVKTPNMVLQDLTFNYNYKKWAFQFEVQNLANKQPPFLANTSDNSNDSTYSGYYAGRTFLLQAGTTF